MAQPPICPARRPGLSVLPGMLLGMLTVRDTMTLDMERHRWKYGGAKAAAVREVFDESLTLYYQRLDELIDRPEALAHDPLVVNRLRRLREQRQAARRGAPRGAASRPA